MPASIEQDLVAKLVRLWHLSAPERRQLPLSEVKGSLVIAAVAEVVGEDGWYPSTWRPDQPFDGGLIERTAANTYIVHWKAEVGVGRFELQETQSFRTPADASEAYAKRFFGAAIDGVPINWER